MTQYNLTFSPSELETIQTLMVITIDRLESMSLETNEVLDSPLLSIEQYNMYLGCLANITKDMANMRGILSRIELLHDQ